MSRLSQVNQSPIHAAGSWPLFFCAGFRPPFVRVPRERDNATLRSLLEPKYRAVGAAPPPVPIWSGRRSFGETYGSSVGSAATNVGNAPSKRVVELLRSTPLFVIEGKQVKAKVVSTAGAVAAAASGAAKRDGERQSDGRSSAPGSAAADLGGNRRHALLVRAAVKALTEVVGRVCESREEAFLKARLPGAQAYTVELERYGSTIAGGSALRATASSPEGDWASAGSVEVDDDLWRLFAAQETRLYSSSAALGKKPGRLYVTYSTLWFHSKVDGEAVGLINPRWLCGEECILVSSSPVFLVRPFFLHTILQFY